MSVNCVTRNLCPVCDYDEHEIICSYPLHDKRIWGFLEIYYKGRIPEEKLDFDYCVVRCGKCSLLFQKDILAEENMYLLYEEWISAEESLQKKEFADISLFAGYSSDLQAASRFLGKKPHEIRMLEFGMGWGFFLKVASAFNFQAVGLELSEARIKYAEKKGLKVVRDIRAEKQESYDFIYAGQVFEHIPDPARVIRELAVITKEDGIIQIHVPAGTGMEAKLAGADWQAQKDALHPLEHINCYNDRSFMALGERAGLISVSPRDSRKTFGVRKFLKSVLAYRSKSPVSSINVYFKKV